MLPLLALLLLTAPALPAGEKQISAAELLKLGFFQDFDELNLEELLGAGQIRTRVASGREDTLEEAPSSVVVVTAEEIQALGARTLEDVLVTLPGFDVVTDTFGRSTLTVRGVAPGASGGGSENVLVLFNGRRLNDAVTGGALALNRELPAQAIQRLEVVRGPASSLYGPNALAAVVNVVTARLSEFEGIELEAGGGSFGELRGGLRVGAAVKSVAISGFLHYSDVDGEALPIPADAHSAAGLPSIAPGRTRDDQRSLETAFLVEFGEFAANLRVKNENAAGFVGYEDALGTQNDLNNRQIGVDLRWHKAIGDGTLAAGAGYLQSELRDLYEVFAPGFEIPTAQGGVTRFPAGVFLQSARNSRRFGLDASYDRVLGDKHVLRAAVEAGHETTYGLDAKGNLDFDTLEPQEGLAPLTDVLADASRGSFGVSLQDRFALSSRVTLTGALRLDHADDYGSEVSPRLAAVAALPRDFVLRLGYARSFRPPSFQELYFALPGLLGNPELEPTTNDALEAAVSFKRRDLRLSGTLFWSRVGAPIGPAAPYSPQQPQLLVNLPDLEVLGFEIEGRRNFGVADSLFASWTHQQAEARDSGAAAAGVPKDLLTLGATFRIRERLSITATLLGRGERPRAPGDPRPPLAGYATANLNLRAKDVWRTLDLVGTAFNLFDEENFDPARLGGVPGDYPRSGRSLFFGAAYRF